MSFLKVLVTLLALTWTFEAEAQGARVVDGDTLEIEGISYRLHGIDAPEHGQECNKKSGGTWACGKQATKFVMLLVKGKTVLCENKGTDAYNRVIAVCMAGGIDINSELVTAGLAWAYTKYSYDYVSEEQTARNANLGVWQATTQTPWDYRKSRWNAAEQKAPEGCPIKGNISRSGKKIYHPPWSPWYSKTRISVAKGERWFCTEEEAKAAGWRTAIFGN